MSSSFVREFKQSRLLTLTFSTILAVAAFGVCSDYAFAQQEQTASTADSDQNATVGNNSNFNNINQNLNQVPINNINGSNLTNRVDFPDNFPLDNPIYTPVNTENDFGFNLSAGVNTLDASNVTVYLGFIYHPGRTASHKARMARLRKETELLEVQKQNMQVQLSLLQKQVEEAELRLQRLRESSGPLPSNNP